MAVPALVLAAMGYAHRWVTEDAFIVLRVAQHLELGHGPVFNIGERVEAYTSPLWLALIAAWQAVGGSAETGAVMLGLLASVGGLLLAQAGAARLAARLAPADGSADPPLPVPLGAAVFAAVPVAWDFTTSGLESGLVTLWLGAVFWLLARSRPTSVRRFRMAAFAIGLGPLVRPELALFSLAFAAVLPAIDGAGRERQLRLGQWIGLGGIAVAVPLAYQIFRMGYFAALVPNTALAKEAAAASWAHGWRYTMDFAGSYALWCPLLVSGLWAGALLGRALRSGNRADAALVAAPILAGLASWLYVTRIGGDFMHGRFLLPSLLGVLLPTATVLVPRAALFGWRGVGIAAVAGWAVICALWLRPPYAGAGVTGPDGITDERGFYAYHMKTPNPVRIAQYARHPYFATFEQELARHDRAVLLPSGDGWVPAAPLAASVPAPFRVVVGAEAVGILGYIAGPSVRVIDRQGLADPIASRLLLATRGRPGHEKHLPEAWILARFAAREAAVAAMPASGDAARALECGELADLLRAVNGRLTPPGFIANMRAAWRLSQLRVPADPEAARERFCAPGRARRAAARVVRRPCQAICECYRARDHRAVWDVTERRALMVWGGWI